MAGDTKRKVFSKKKALESKDPKTFLKGVIYLMKDNVKKGKTTQSEKTKIDNDLRGISAGWDKEKDKKVIKKVSDMLGKLKNQLLKGEYTKAQESAFNKLAKMYPRYTKSGTKKPTAKDILAKNFDKMF